MLTLATALAAALHPGQPHFKKGVGGGGMCSDMGTGPGGLSTVSFWYDWGHERAGYAACNGSYPQQEYVPMVWGKWALANASHP